MEKSTISIDNSLKVVRCPWCGLCDHVVESGRPGSISVCGRCFEPSIFTPSGALRRMTGRDYRKLSILVQFQVRGVIENLRRMHEEQIAKN